MKKLKTLLLIGALFYMGNINAQGVNLRLDSNALNGLADTSFIGQVDSFYINIYNDSITYFEGTISIESKIDGILYTGDSIQDPIYYPNSGVFDSIGAHDTVQRLLIIHVTNPPFIIGTSGVVIWPIALTQTHPTLPAVISDSIYKTVTVLYPVGINEITERNLKVYMSNQQLIIQDDGAYLLKNVKLYDVSGKLLNEQELSTSGTLNMNQYAAGVYLAEVNFADNTRMIFKVFNTR